MPAKLACRDDLGLALTFLRRIRGWEQAELAQASGVSTASVRALERSRRQRPSFKTLGPITVALGADLGVLAEVVALIQRLRMGSSGGRPTGSAFSAVPALRREITSLVAAGWRCGEPEPSLGGLEACGEAPPSREGGQTLGLAVTFLRWIKGRTQVELAALSGVRLKSIQDLEEGGRERSTPRTLGRLESALDVEPATLAEVAGLMSKLRQGMVAASAGADENVQARASQVIGDARALRREITTLIQPACVRALPGRFAPDREVARRGATTLWALLEGDGEAWIGLVQQIGELQTAELCELVCDESVKAAADSAERARRLAELAIQIAERVQGTEGWRTRLLGYADFHLANALRVDGKDLPAAGDALERARGRWDAGAADDPGLLNAARVMSLEASMRRAQRRVPEALALLDKALAIDRWGETPSLLLGKAGALVEIGDYEASIAVLKATVGQIDAEREPRQRWVALDLLLHNLCLVGRHAEAAARLGELRALGRKLGNRLDLLRLAWLEGKIAAGTGRLEEAIATLERVRAEFLNQKSSYDVALVTLEQAEILVELGRHAAVKALAQESVPMFLVLGVQVEAQRALELFCRAAEEERASAEQLRGLLAYLYRARRDPLLRFETAAS
jgi:transcriptional regulator with XRE-family HTH domain/tetratricopeptide (TPR) repeat protein